jgi:hypothetical protein
MTVLTCGLVLQSLYGVPATSATFWLLPGLRCFVGRNGQWVVFSVMVAAGRAGRDVVGGARSPPNRDLLTQPVLAGCGRALWLVGPWLDYPRARHQ